MRPIEPVDLTGFKVGKLTVLKLGPKGTHNHAYWECLCECGNSIIARGISLKHGAPKSCGKCPKPIRPPTQDRHGLSGTKIGKAWEDMKSRCFNQNNPSWKSYGGRGITVCCNIFKSPIRIKDLIGIPEPGLSLERIDNSKSYSCGNCDQCLENGWKLNIKWATRIEQARNTRRTHKIEIDGISKCVSEWSDLSGIKRETLFARLRYGWSPDRLLTTPQKTSRIYTKIIGVI